MAIQPHSKISNAVEQGELPLTRPAPDQDVSVDTILRRRDLLGAINLCIDLSGLEDKEIYVPLKIDAGHFSHIRKGKPGVHFPTNKLNDLMRLCGNQVPLIWLAHSNGFGLHMLETEAERQMKALREQLETERLKNSVLMDAVRGGR